MPLSNKLDANMAQRIHVKGDVFPQLFLCWAFTTHLIIVQSYLDSFISVSMELVLSSEYSVSSVLLKNTKQYLWLISNWCANTNSYTLTTKSMHSLLLCKHDRGLVFYALHPTSPAMVMAGLSVHLTTLFLGKLEQAVNQNLVNIL